MKFLKYIFTIILFFHALVFAQTDSVEYALRYYPLEIGNYWEYELNSSDNPYGPFNPFYSLEVVGDTVFSNSKEYKTIARKYFNSGDVRYEYKRIDSSSTNVYQYDLNDEEEFRIDSLLIRPGDSIAASRFGPVPENEKVLVCEEEYQTEIFDENWTIKEYTDYGQLPSQLYRLANGLGEIYNWMYEGNFWIERLTYAKIGEKEYGIKTSISQKDNLPNEYILYNNYPNPFNPSTEITFFVPKASEVKLIICNSIGEEIEKLIDEVLYPGIHTKLFENKMMSSGVYFYSLITDEIVITKKMLLLK